MCKPLRTAVNGNAPTSSGRCFLHRRVPQPRDAIKERRKYIAAMREYIYKRRSEKLKEFMQVTHPDQSDYR